MGFPVLFRVFRGRYKRKDPLYTPGNKLGPAKAGIDQASVKAKPLFAKPDSIQKKQTVCSCACVGDQNIDVVSGGIKFVWVVKLNVLVLMFGKRWLIFRTSPRLWLDSDVEAWPMN
jgi:hypothetical protein